MISRFLVVFCTFCLTAVADQLAIVSFGKDEKIAVYALDQGQGSLALKSSLALDAGAGPMCVNHVRTRLYVGMKGHGKLAVFKINSDATLTALGDTTVGADASFLTLHPSGTFLLTSYYKAGKAAVHRVLDDGTLSAEPSQFIETDERAHCIICDPSGQFSYVPHTRPNSIHQFRFDAEKGTLTPLDPPELQREDNSGPRHLWFHPTNKHAYGSDEQGRAAATYQMNPQTGTLRLLETLPTKVPESFTERRSTSDIEVHPSGKFVYLANRGYNFIVPFKVDPRTAKLTALKQAATEEVTRSFNIAPDGKHLIAAGQRSGNLAVFKIETDGNLTRTSTLKAGINPWWVEVIDAPSQD